MTVISNISHARDKIEAKDVALPAVYQKAVALIKDTITLDESKYWVDKTEALCAWAQMYHDDQVGVQAKRLRLHAYRRMGQLAQEIQPAKNVAGGGRTPGPVALLRKAGLSRHGAAAATKLGKLPEREAKQLINAEQPVAPTTYERRTQNQSALAAFRNCQRTPFSCRIFCQEVTPKQAASKMKPLERGEAVKQLRELSMWIDRFISLCQP